MDVSKLDHSQRQLRMSVRNFLLAATRDDLMREWEISLERNDTFRTQCIEELIDELGPEAAPSPS